MSLTRLLDNRSSTLSLWMDQTFNRKKITRLVSEINDQLSVKPPLLVESHKDYALVGTAFDYLFRWKFGPLTKVVAFLGVFSFLEKPIAKVIVKEIIERGNEAGNNLRQRAEYTVMLSWFEWVFRAGYAGEQVTAALQKTDIEAAIHTLHEAINPAVVDDLLLLYDSIPTVWGDVYLWQKPTVLNPVFSGSSDVDGADADWIIDGTLYECKVSKQTRPCDRRTILQILGYVLLDYLDEYRIRTVGFYYARQQMRLTYSLDELLPSLGVEGSLSNLRSEMRWILTS